MRSLLALALLILAPLYSNGSNVYDTLPEKINPNERYVFYSHGYIVEGTNPKPIHPRWGTYDFPAIVNRLAALNATIIAEHRPSNTDPFTHAHKLKAQVQQLIKSGVSPNNITFVGFSRGGFITAITSNLLANDEINYVILAACTSSLSEHDEIVLYGNILSIYETSDSVGSCEQVIQRSDKNISSFKEIAISTGKEHGAFYHPIDSWIKPLTVWFGNQ